MNIIEKSDKVTIAANKTAEELFKEGRENAASAIIRLNDLTIVEKARIFDLFSLRPLSHDR